MSFLNFVVKASVWQVVSLSGLWTQHLRATVIFNRRMSSALIFITSILHFNELTILFRTFMKRSYRMCVLITANGTTVYGRHFLGFLFHDWFSFVKSVGQYLMKLWNICNNLKCFSLKILCNIFILFNFVLYFST